MVNEVYISAGLRVGFWNPSPKWGQTPFICKGHYNGPDLGHYLPGSKIKQDLLEGELLLRVGVLFRPDLGNKSRLETILILENYIEEMFEYQDWEVATG